MFWIFRDDVIVAEFSDKFKIGKNLSAFYFFLSADIAKDKLIT